MKAKFEKPFGSPGRNVLLVGMVFLVLFEISAMGPATSEENVWALKDDAGEVVFSIDSIGWMFVEGEVHTSANVAQTLSTISESDILWKAKDSTGTEVAAVYKNSGTGDYDLALKGSLVAFADFSNYSSVDDYWEIDSTSSTLASLKQGGSGLTDGSLLLAGQLLPGQDCYPWFYGLTVG